MACGKAISLITLIEMSLSCSAWCSIIAYLVGQDNPIPPQRTILLAWGWSLLSIFHKRMLSSWRMEPFWLTGKESLCNVIIFRVVKKVTPVLGGFDSKNYVAEREWAKADDGTEIPISIVYRKGLVKLDGSDPMLLDAYGSYGICNDPR